MKKQYTESEKLVVQAEIDDIRKILKGVPAYEGGKNDCVKKDIFQRLDVVEKNLSVTS